MHTPQLRSQVLLWRRQARGRQPLAAFTMVEVMFAIAIVAVGLSGVFVLNSKILQLLREAKQTAAATASLQQRIEQIRTLKWSQVTDANYIEANVFSAASVSQAHLAGQSEAVLISEYPPQGKTKNYVGRDSGGKITVYEKNKDQMTETDAVSVLIRVQWNGTEGRARRREIMTLVARNGVNP